MLRMLANPPKALLLEGPGGVGKRELGEWWVSHLMCTSSPTHAEASQIQTRIEVGNQLDYHVLASPAIGDVRAVLAEAYRAPIKAPYRVLMLPHVEALSEQGADALLKTLEEPPPRARFVLTLDEGSNTGLPHTVRSRCHTLYVGRLEDAVMRELIPVIVEEEFGQRPPESAVETLVYFARGLPTQVVFHVKHGNRLRGDLLELLSRMPRVPDWNLVMWVMNALAKEVTPTQLIDLLEETLCELVAAASGVERAQEMLGTVGMQAVDALGFRVFDIASKSRVLSERAHMSLAHEHHVVSELLQIKERCR